MTGDLIASALWLFFIFLINAYESFMIMHFICSSLGNDRRSKKGKTVFIIGGIISIPLITLFNSVPIYEILFGVLNSMFYFAFSLICFKAPLIKKAFISVLTNAALVAVNIFISNLMAAVFPGGINDLYKGQGIVRFMFIVIIQALQTYVFAVLLKFTGDKSVHLKFREWGLIISVFVVSVFVFLYLNSVGVIYSEPDLNDYKFGQLLIAEFDIIIINIICWYMTLNLSKTRKHEEQLEAEARLSEYNAKYSEMAKQQYDEVYRICHDIKQHFAVLDGLLSEGKYSEASEYLGKNYDAAACGGIITDVGNDFLNAIINTKLTYAVSCGIEVICSTEKNFSDGFDDTDLCTLIGNMLDNAIEAAQKCDPELRMIELKIFLSGSRLNIITENSTERPVLAENPELLTTKKDAEKHGFGSKTIKHIAKKYNGTADFYEDKNKFVSRVAVFKN